MHFQATPLARALSIALATLPYCAMAQNAAPTLPAVVVTASPLGTEEDLHILAPARVLRGAELRDKLGTTLGDTLASELGVSSSAFGAGAARPIIRGLDGPRVKILQNGMAVSDLSAISNDHAVGAGVANARQIEILRGPAALLYGSGAIGGLVNVVDGRIPDRLLPKAAVQAELRAGSVDGSHAVALAADGAAGQVGVHLDAALSDANEYRIAGNAVRNDPTTPSDRLPNSWVRRNDVGLGATWFGSRGFVGASIGVMQDRYGIPTAERPYIELAQTRLDIAGQLDDPLPGFSALKFKLANSDYRHSEIEEDGTPATDFANRARETRWELQHAPLAGWRGVFGIQTEHSRFSALSAATGTPDTVPITRSRSLAAFVVEERDFNALRASFGARIESVKRRPDAAAGLADRDFNLHSWSLGGLWRFAGGYGLGATASIAQRAPTTEELYSNGPHEATATFDIGDANMQKETSKNLELSLQKTDGPLRWKANLFRNRVANFVYGRMSGVQVDDDGVADPAGEFAERFWSQGAATIRGMEAELSYNWRGEGWSWRGFADASRGRLDGQGNLPLQPATRFGAELGYKAGPWQGGAMLLRARAQDRLAAFETFVTPAYTRLDASVSHTRRYGPQQVTWFLVAKNLLDEDIRVSTSVLRASAPLPGRGLTLGVRAQF